MPPICTAADLYTHLQIYIKSTNPLTGRAAYPYKSSISFIIVPLGIRPSVTQQPTPT